MKRLYSEKGAPRCVRCGLWMANDATASDHPACDPAMARLAIRAARAAVRRERAA